MKHFYIQNSLSTQVQPLPVATEKKKIITHVLYWNYVDGLYTYNSTSAELWENSGLFTSQHH